MSSRNNDSSELAILGAVLGFMALFVFSLLAFIALLLTFLALVAWFRPLKLGSMTIEPSEARAFVYRGLLGAVLAPSFAKFTEWFLKFRVDDEYWFYIIVGGYILGSMGAEFLEDEEETETIRTLPRPQQTTAPPQKSLPDSNVVPFKFADWNDTGKDQ